MKSREIGSEYFPVYIHRDVLNEIRDLSRKSKNEIFGYLVGLVLSRNYENYIKILNQIHIRDSITSEKFTTCHLEGTAGNYVREYNKLKEKNPNLLIVGWWHSHIGLGCFLSPTDTQTQEYFFPESHQVALVVDPVRDEYKFFTLDINSKSKYKELKNAVLD